MFTQISNYIEEHLSPYLFGFRKSHSVEQCLMSMLETWKRAVDNKKCVGAVLTDLSKAFDSLNHELIIAKFEAYGFHLEALVFIYDYLTKRTQRTKVKSDYSSEREIKYGVPQGSILGHLVFNINLNDMFFFITKSKIANWADDNTPYVIEDNVEKLLDSLKEEANVILDWFDFNEMKANSDKSHLLVINSKNDKIILHNEEIIGEEKVKLLGVTIDNKLNFEEHITMICKKANQKLHALARVAK